MLDWKLGEGEDHTGKRENGDDGCAPFLEKKKNMYERY